MREIISDVINGKFIIILDDESRENEGDLVISGSLVNHESISLMSKLGGGVPVVAISQSIATKLDLKILERRNISENGAMYAQTVDARYGLTGNGCSTHDRALTIQTLANPLTTVDEITTPGHVMTVIGHKDGLNARLGHTEASISLMKIAGFSEVALICEVIGDHGNPLKGISLMKFADYHEIKITTIDNIKSYK
ncbi:3,4-dihydroxy-2-butanone-4-phosphate synthase [Lyticum sinuosum]|uniref:3,4-dihydroxy-2-butanone 4-phosphate synthase n=1 Tax=Lyticum sinuosum TaxID=1332059 RepID=A0AAE4VKF3_9RICK|nr:3,4-dihydroxy-2-butanone-4-phosphate synthase [Lyticum sinuosum]MDZ5761601.1 Riboflavin biosynthesis protein RibB [Lyticum sinuosum]